ncbi:MAG: galactose-1-phosphate uridylyltransferase [Candidatus Nitrosocaldaceae archaeon]|nr:MAG: galactose-1-phosphate uridylyltransferase [Candidatus Nitrosocaldaceae archaeon]
MFKLAELRHDHIFEKFVIIPNSNKKEYSNGNCPYCLGNESMTNATVLALVQKNGMLKRVYDDSEEINNWCVRVFPSNNPIVTQDTDTTYADKPFAKEPAYGHHYILALAPDHRSPSKLSVEHWTNILVALQDRIKWLYSKKGVTYVSVFMNNSKFIHPHMNIITLSSIPPIIEKTAISVHKYIDEKGSCPICDIVKYESNSSRQIFATNYFIAICPWASTHPYKLRILPKKHTVNFTRITQKDIDDLALIIRVTLGALANTIESDEFNLVFRLPPEKKQSKQFHLCIDIYPNDNEASILGDEFGIYINRLKPEDAASKLAYAARREFAEIMGVK